MHALAQAVLLVALAVMGAVVVVNRRHIRTLEERQRRMDERLHALGVVDEVIAQALHEEPPKRRHLRAVKGLILLPAGIDLARRHAAAGAILAASATGVVGVATLTHTPHVEPVDPDVPAVAPWTPSTPRRPARPMRPEDEAMIAATEPTTTTTTEPGRSPVPSAVTETTTTVPSTTTTTTTTTAPPLVTTTTERCVLVEVTLPDVVDTCI